MRRDAQTARLLHGRPALAAVRLTGWRLRMLQHMFRLSPDLFERLAQVYRLQRISTFQPWPELPVR